MTCIWLLSSLLQGHLDNLLKEKLTQSNLNSMASMVLHLICVAYQYLFKLKMINFATIFQLPPCMLSLADYHHNCYLL